MKLRLYILFAVILLSCTKVYSQVDDTSAAPIVKPLPVDVQATPSVQAQVKATPAARRAVNTDTIKGNARNDVAMVSATGSCANGMKPTGITNKSTTKLMMVRVDVMVTFHGKMSKKSILVDNLSPGETRNVGCAGCVDNQTGQTCTTYKIIAAAFK